MQGLQVYNLYTQQLNQAEKLIEIHIMTYNIVYKGHNEELWH